MSRRIDKDDLMNPVVVAHDDIGGDWHIRIGSPVGKPFTFLTATEAREVADAWTSLALDLAAREGITDREAFIEQLIDTLRAPIAPRQVP